MATTTPPKITHKIEKQAILAEPRLEERLRGALELIKEQVRV